MYISYILLLYSHCRLSVKAAKREDCPMLLLWWTSSLCKGSSEKQKKHLCTAPPETLSATAKPFLARLLLLPNLPRVLLSLWS